MSKFPKTKKGHGCRSAIYTVGLRKIVDDLNKAGSTCVPLI